MFQAALHGQDNVVSDRVSRHVCLPAVGLEVRSRSH